MHTIEFQPEHISLLEARKEEIDSVLCLGDAVEKYGFLKEASLDCRTFVHEGRIIFIAGYVELWPGVVECWMLPSVYVESLKLSFCRILKDYVESIIVDRKCHRFQTSAPDDDLHSRWMEFLGLEKEGTFRNYTHNKRDYCMYARVI